jgi:hypothetical protein
MRRGFLLTESKNGENDLIRRQFLLAASKTEKMTQ